MERRIINPWTWQDQLGYVQANEVSGTLPAEMQTSRREQGVVQVVCVLWDALRRTLLKFR